MEDKEKAPQIKSPTEIPGLEKKKSSKPDENIEITAEELNEVKNLPDIVISPPQKETKERRASTKEKSEPIEEVKMKYEKKNPPSYQRPVAAEIAKKARFPGDRKNRDGTGDEKPGRDYFTGNAPGPIWRNGCPRRPGY